MFARKKSISLSPRKFSSAGSPSRERGEAGNSSQGCVIPKSRRLKRSEVILGHMKEVREVKDPAWVVFYAGVELRPFSHREFAAAEEA